MSIETKAREIGIPVDTLTLERTAQKKWRSGDNVPTSVERAVLQHYEADGWVGHAGEHRLICSLLGAMSAPSAPVFAKKWGIPFKVFHEAVDQRSSALDCIKNSNRNQVSNNALFLLSDEGGIGPITRIYPGLEHWMLLGLFDALGHTRLCEIAALLSSSPYQQVVGWPDITMWKGKDVRFLEVKAPRDQLRDSQEETIKNVLLPASLEVAIVRVKERKTADHASRTQLIPRKFPPFSDRNSPDWFTVFSTLADLDRDQYWLEYTDLPDEEHPLDKLHSALDELPSYPGFVKSATRARALVRRKRKSRQPYASELMLLYEIAAIASFPKIAGNNNVPFPNFNILFAASTTEIRELPLFYPRLGYKKVRLLTKTDISHIVNSWGEPEAHSRLHTLANRLWQDLCAEFWTRQDQFLRCPNCERTIPKREVLTTDVSRHCSVCRTAALSGSTHDIQTDVSTPVESRRIRCD